MVEAIPSSLLDGSGIRGMKELQKLTFNHMLRMLKKMRNTGTSRTDFGSGRKLRSRVELRVKLDIEENEMLKGRFIDRVVLKLHMQGEKLDSAADF